ncbi:J domain-containing protein [Acidithiobacillus caldus]|uniref:J domain-containing protein n=1 Tax=Acidithiobacillus caldus TaxID=33059 RepID=UPI001C06FD30|nr:J domain-containing protein [Acidithiobacillus caldus]MBU2770133.1 DnaJ domain-containing protein [Acidithiobacillus caldus]
MNIIDAAEVLNVRHDADHLVVKAAYHALSKKHHPDRGGDTATMQRINAAHDYMSTRTPQARKAEWERLQKPVGYSGSLDDLWKVREAQDAKRRAAEAKTDTAKAQAPRYTTRTWTPPKPSKLEQFQNWKRRQKWPVRWALALLKFLLIMAGRLGWLAVVWYGFYLLIVWAIGVTEQTLGIIGLFVAIFGGAAVVSGLGLALLVFSGNFLMGGWKGLFDFLNDRHTDPYAKRSKYI